MPPTDRADCHDYWAATGFWPLPAHWLEGPIKRQGLGLTLRQRLSKLDDNPAALPPAPASWPNQQRWRSISTTYRSELWPPFLRTSGKQRGRSSI